MTLISPDNLTSKSKFRPQSRYYPTVGIKNFTKTTLTSHPTKHADLIHSLKNTRFQTSSLRRRGATVPTSAPAGQQGTDRLPATAAWPMTRCPPVSLPKRWEPSCHLAPDWPSVVSWLQQLPPAMPRPGAKDSGRHVSRFLWQALCCQPLEELFCQQMSTLRGQEK